VGITSWGLDTACAGDAGLPGVYVNVKYFVDWIDAVLQNIAQKFPGLKESIDLVLEGQVAKADINQFIDDQQ